MNVWAAWEEIHLVGGQVNPGMCRKSSFLRPHLWKTEHQQRTFNTMSIFHLLLQHSPNGCESNWSKPLSWKLNLKRQERLIAANTFPPCKHTWRCALWALESISWQMYQNLSKHQINMLYFFLHYAWWTTEAVSACDLYVVGRSTPTWVTNYPPATELK